MCVGGPIPLQITTMSGRGGGALSKKGQLVTFLALYFPYDSVCLQYFSSIFRLHVPDAASGSSCLSLSMSEHFFWLTVYTSSKNFVNSVGVNLFLSI